MALPKNNGRAKKAKIGIKVPWFLVIPGLVCALIAHFIAPIQGAFYAFTDFKGIGSYNFIWFDNFKTMWESTSDKLAILNTFKLAIPFVLLTCVLGLILALVLCHNFKTKFFMRSVLFAPAVMIPLAITQIWKYIFNFDGPLNLLLQGMGLGHLCQNWLGTVEYGLTCILIVMLWQNMGYAMVIFNAGLQSIPEELYEAASIDGANAWKRFWNVTLPQLAPSFTVVITLMTITGLRVFDQVIGLTNGGPAGSTHTLASDYYIQTWAYGRYGYGTALALVLTLLVTVVGIIEVLAGAGINANFVGATVNSLLITAGSLVLLIVFGSLAAYCLARHPGKVSNIMYIFFVIGIIIPSQLGLVPMYCALRDLGLVGNIAGMMILYTCKQMPMTVFLYTGFFRQFPIDFEEAATIDGAGYFKSFFLVVLPQLKAITGTAILLNALYIWNDTFDQMVFLSGAAAKTLPVEIYALTTAMTAQWNLVFAAVIISLVPMLILYLLTQKKMMTSLAGGIKG